MIGKIYKYEFINTSKVLLPLYIILIVLGLFSGIFNKSPKINDSLFQYDEPEQISPFDDDLKMYPEEPMLTPEFEKKSNPSTHQISYNTNSNVNTPVQYSFHFQSNNKNIALPHLVTGLLGFSFMILMEIILIVTIIILCRRFKKSLFEDEAYLNLSLPVTMGEHLWGRFLCYLTWILICFLAMTLAFCLSTFKMIDLSWLKSEINTLNSVFLSKNVNIPLIYINLFISTIITCATIILFSFCVTSLSHLFKEHRTLAKIIIILILLAITSKTYTYCFSNISFQDIKSLTVSLETYILANLILCILFMTSSHLVLLKKLNLE